MQAQQTDVSLIAPLSAAVGGGASLGANRPYRVTFREKPRPRIA
ncbi:MAG TPA: hypothetical protein VF798_00615 [Burkholderiaceae bacterium]